MTEPTLNNLVAGITEENRHPEQWTAPMTEPTDAIDDQMLKAVIRSENDTIERCAQVADHFQKINDGDVGDLALISSHIAAAIRALSTEGK